MAFRLRSGWAVTAVIAGILVSGCAGQVSAHSISREAPVAAPAIGREALPGNDRDLDGVGRAAYLVAAVAPAPSADPPPFVCEVMDMTAAAVDDGDDASAEAGP